MLYDVIVVGSGIAGLFAALEAKKAGNNVAVVAKSNPFRSNSAVASGGINAVIDTNSYEALLSHIDDTIAGADGIANRKNIENMCKAAPSIVEELAQMGVGFNTLDNGELAQRPFGGSTSNRTCYVADRTGSAIVQKLLLECRNAGVHILANHIMLSITKYKQEMCGITLLRRRNSQVTAFACKALVLAGGGYAGIYLGHTTNSQESSGDLLAIALRAGMRLSNMEFVQFHPTTMLKSGALISEAARGEGGLIVDESGEKFVDPLLTRDKLSRAILEYMKHSHEVFLDLRHLSPELIEEKLPSMQKVALSGGGIDVTKDLLPIAPSAHYSIGGIWTREDTSTDLARVFACGECAASGVHGANRLGGNSLLEGAYFGKVAGREAAKVATMTDFKPIDFVDVEKEARRVENILEGEDRFNINAMRKNLGETLFKEVGVFRSEEGMTKALEYIHYLMKQMYGLHCVNKELDNNVELLSIIEFKNALLVAEAMTLCAIARRESRGVHFVEEYPVKDEKHFNVASYIEQLSYNYMKVSFEDVERFDFKYYITKMWYAFRQSLKH